ncbi:hypothetical protein NPIL_8571 [Nephila pilipes]|uniref:Uncharacterized protein n=1 Tax=Nephila pilipes TaxID=299642 RepID=A0A8X6Q8F3_NEPPI|nr:hypothetical protein NPIL_8571 [Nephila pilipes]
MSNLPIQGECNCSKCYFELYFSIKRIIFWTIIIAIYTVCSLSIFGALLRSVHILQNWKKRLHNQLIENPKSADVWPFHPEFSCDESDIE